MSRAGSGGRTGGATGGATDARSASTEYASVSFFGVVHARAGCGGGVCGAGAGASLGSGAGTSVFCGAGAVGAERALVATGACGFPESAAKSDAKVRMTFFGGAAVGSTSAPSSPNAIVGRFPASPLFSTESAMTGSSLFYLTKAADTAYTQENPRVRAFLCSFLSMRAFNLLRGLKCRVRRSVTNSQKVKRERPLSARADEKLSRIVAHIGERMRGLLEFRGR